MLHYPIISYKFRQNMFPNERGAFSTLIHRSFILQLSPLDIERLTALLYSPLSIVKRSRSGRSVHHDAITADIARERK